MLGEHDQASRPPRPARPTPPPAPADVSRPFDGLRVLDLTSFWAGPVATHTLALLGAEVLHVESTARPDGTRLLAGLRFSEPDWWERSGIFSGLNTNKQSVTLDLAGEPGRELLRRLVATCDVIVENYTPRVLDQIGLDIDAIRAIRPDVVVVRMPGFGLDGPWRDAPAFAFVIEDASGLTWLTGHPDETPVSPYCVGDPNAGTHALVGLLLALEHRRRTGEGVVVEASMVDAALNVAAEQIVEHSAYGALLERDGNRGPTAAPQNLYRTADTDDAGDRDAWVAIAVATDDQWVALREAIGRPDWAMDRRARRPLTAVGASTTPSTTTWRAGATSAAATRSSTVSGVRGSRSPRCSSHTSRRPFPSCSTAGSSRPSTIPSRAPLGTARCPSGSPAARPGSTAARPRCSASTPTRSCTPWGCRTPR